VNTAEKPIEVRSEHRCILGVVTERLAQKAAGGTRGEELAEEARAALQGLWITAFEQCCVPVYLALAPERFEREIQIPIASADVAKLDTRALLWPIGAQDGQHPHFEGWATFVVIRGRLAVSETRDEARVPERIIETGAPEVIDPADCVAHHIHNRGDEIGMTVHIFNE
jgi:hypothetical protein